LLGARRGRHRNFGPPLIQVKDAGVPVDRVSSSRRGDLVMRELLLAAAISKLILGIALLVS
jgi:hypothetical protein